MDSPLATDCQLALMQRTDYMYVLPRAQMVVVRLVRGTMAVVAMAVPVRVQVRAWVLAQMAERAGRVVDTMDARAPPDLMVAPAGSARA